MTGGKEGKLDLDILGILWLPVILMGHGVI